MSLISDPSITIRRFDVKPFDLDAWFDTLGICDRPGPRSGSPSPAPPGSSAARSRRWLTQAGPYRCGWVLLNLKIGRAGNQRRLAEVVGVTEATLTHHLNAMETAGLLTRRRDPNNRRIHVVELTDAGEAAFMRLREAAVAFDRSLRRGVSAGEARALEDVLNRLAANVADNENGAPPWVGLIDGPI